MQRQISVVQINDVINQLEKFDAIVDVRSPSEFQTDHIPGAINLFVLDDTERAKIGSIYKNIGSFAARKLGGCLTSKNIASHIFDLQDKSKVWKPLIYCWRGGQRSRSMALVMREIGWPVTVLEGGYKSFRRHISSELSRIVNQYHLLVLTGPTGTGKTRLLEQMQSRGLQVLDLEGLAKHRGSILGQQPEVSQPTQKFFETTIFFALAELDPNRPVWVESESSKIGDLHIPMALFKKIGVADAVLVTCPIKQRVEFLLEDYAHLTADSITTKDLISQLSFRQTKRRINAWEKLIKEECWKRLAHELLIHHYDPAYAKSQRRLNVIRTIELKDAAILPDALLDADYEFN